MNLRQAELYRNLMAIVASNDAFYFQDFVQGNTTVRIFNYRLASYTDFLLPDALECRGHAFSVDGAGNAIEMLAWCPEKFFNLFENPMTMDLDLSQVDEVYDKLDGSLISTYMLDDQLMLKSKGSVSSEQALDAMKWLDGQSSFQKTLRDTTMGGYTVNLEWIGMSNRIVIGYLETSLKVLTVRSRLDGSYMSYDDVVSTFGAHNVVTRKEVGDPVAFVASVPSMQDDIEGFVIKLKSDQRFKIKTEKYMSLHHAKDSINNPRRLFEAILDEGIDDLRSMFSTDAVAMKMIDEMQVKVNHLYNAMVKAVEGFYEANKDLDRKSYAIKAQEHFAGTMYFGQAMSRYLGKTVDYKGFLKSKWKELGLRDEKVVEDDE